MEKTTLKLLIQISSPTANCPDGCPNIKNLPDDEGCGLDVCMEQVHNILHSLGKGSTPSPSACKASPSGCKSESVEKVIAAAKKCVNEFNDEDRKACRCCGEEFTSHFTAWAALDELQE